MPEERNPQRKPDTGRRLRRCLVGDSRGPRLGSRPSLHQCALGWVSVATSEIHGSRSDPPAWQVRSQMQRCLLEVPLFPKIEFDIERHGLDNGSPRAVATCSREDEPDCQVGDAGRARAMPNAPGVPRCRTPALVSDPLPAERKRASWQVEQSAIAPTRSSRVVWCTPLPHWLTFSPSVRWRSLPGYQDQSWTQR